MIKNYIFKKLLFSFLWIFLGLFFSLLIRLLIFEKVQNAIHVLFASLSMNNYLGIASITLFSVATLGRLGWKGQTWDGESPVEKLDRCIFWIFYLLGTIFGSLAFLL